MGIFSHVRMRFWDAERYTQAQAEEFRQLRGAYETHLGTLPAVLQLRHADDPHYPAWTLATRESSTAPVRREATPLQAFSDTLSGMLAVYAQRRSQRFYGKGHSNDPLRLWERDIGAKFRGLAFAPLDQSTLNQIIAWRSYLDTLQRQAIFSHEPTGHDSVNVLLRNLDATLALAADRLQYEIALSSAREHLHRLKNSLSQAIQETASYLFYAVAEKPRQNLHYSPLAAQAEIVDEKVTASLQTREGTLLKNLFHDPAIVHTVLPQGNGRKQSTSPAVSLLGGDTPTPFMDRKGEVEERWVDFLRHPSSGEEQLAPDLKDLPSGVCSLFTDKRSFTEEKTDRPDPLLQFVGLHGLLLTLAHYYSYVQQCWQLAGFGGDTLLYDRLAEALISILKELQTFQSGLQQRIGAFQKELDSTYAEAVKLGQHAAWQQNYHQAKIYQNRAIEEFNHCERLLTTVMTHAKDAGKRQQRGALAAEAQERLQDAGRFLNRARCQIGLREEKEYPGLAIPSDMDRDIVYPSHFLTEFDPLLLALVPEQTQQVARLGRLCREVASRQPWRIFRGSRRRHEYLNKGARLAEIGALFAALRVSPHLSDIERKEYIADLRRRIADEKKLIARLKEGLWWLVHRASSQFFTDWDTILNNCLVQLGLWERTHATVQSAGISASVHVMLPKDSHNLSENLLVLKPYRADHRLPAPTSSSSDSEQLAPKDKEILFTVYQQYQQHPSSQHKAAFEQWQQSRFGGLIWETEGQLRSDLHLTETDVAAILEQWVDQSLHYGREVIAQVTASAQSVDTLLTQIEGNSSQAIKEEKEHKHSTPARYQTVTTLGDK